MWHHPPFAEIFCHVFLIVCFYQGSGAEAKEFAHVEYGAIWERYLGAPTLVPKRKAPHGHAPPHV